ncbi:hypothetical protein AAMO2058_001458800 [Amorphochlora amoebiformis]
MSIFFQAIRMSMLTHQNSTDLYLRGIFLDAIDAYAKAKGDEAVLNKENNTVIIPTQHNTHTHTHSERTLK